MPKSDQSKAPTQNDKAPDPPNDDTKPDQSKAPSGEQDPRARVEAQVKARDAAQSARAPKSPNKPPPEGHVYALTLRSCFVGSDVQPAGVIVTLPEHQVKRLVRLGVIEI